MAESEDWITTAECARRTGYHRTHIVDIIKREPAIKSRRFGRAWMVEWHSFAAWMKHASASGDARFGARNEVDKPEE